MKIKFSDTTTDGTTFEIEDTIITNDSGTITYKEGKLPDVWDSIPHGSQCMHDNCPECGGTGIKRNGGGTCIHMISCPCPKCTPWC
jgi:hypothetical protein